MKDEGAEGADAATAKPAAAEKELDIIDETFRVFKSNMLFKSFEIEGPADNSLIYITLYIQQCLLRVQKLKLMTKDAVEKQFFTLSQEKFAAPGDDDFAMGSFFAKAKDATKEKQMWVDYMKQLREEVGIRLVKKLFTEATQTEPNKFWMQFAKKKFLNKAIEN